MKGNYLLLYFLVLTNYILYSQQLKVYLQKGHEKPITELQFDQSGSRLLSKDKGNTWLQWDFFAHQEINRYLSSPSWQPAGPASTAITATLGRKNNKIICKKNGHTFFVVPAVLYGFEEVVVNADESFIAYRTEIDKILFLRPINNMRELRIIDLPVKASALSFHPVLPYLLLAGMEDGSIGVYDIQQGKLVFQLSSALFNTNNIQADNLLGKTVIISQDAWFVKENRHYDKLDFTRFKWKKDAYALTPILKDSQASNFYFWNNYRVYHKDTSKAGVARYMMRLQFNNQVWAPITTYLGHFIIIPDIITMLSNAPYLKWAVDYEPDIKTTSNNIWINRNQTIAQYDLSHKRSRSYMAYGDGHPLYTVNDNFLAIWRAPFYLTIYNLHGKRKKKVGYTEKVTSIMLLGQTDSLILQTHNEFRIIKLAADLESKVKVSGRFVNYFKDQVFYESGGKLLCYGNNSFQPIALPQGLVLKSVISSEKSGQRFYDLYFNFGTILRADSNGKIIGHVYLYKGGDYLVVLPNNYFYASSKKMLQNITINDDAKGSYSLGQLELYYNRPDLVLEQMGSTDTNRLELYRIAYLKNLDRNKAMQDDFVKAQFPTAQITNWNKNYYTKDSFFLCQLYYESTGSVLQSVNVTVNNNPLWGTNGIDISARKVTKFDTLLKVLLKSGDNYIRPVCKDESLLKNKTTTYFIKSDYAVTPTIHYLGIGVNEYAEPEHNLTYATSDVSQLGKSFKNIWGNNCIADSLRNREVTKEAVMQKLQGLQHCGVNDLVIISFSGHGLLNAQLDLFLGTHAVKFSDPTQNGLSYAELEQALEKIPAHRKILFLDACNSGNIDKKAYLQKLKDSLDKNNSVLPAKIIASNQLLKNEDEAYYLMNNIYSNVLEENGAIVMSAARGNQFAREGNKWGSGILTWCIKEGVIDKKADADENGHVSISELKSFLNKEVYKQSNGHQVPVFRRDNDEFDWDIH
ncbi:caspase family protein [Niastella caeni]|nr:caspase family protein [Niastella caeni]